MPTYIRYNIAIGFKDKNNVPTDFQTRVEGLLEAAFYTELEDGLMDIQIRTEEEEDEDDEGTKTPPL